MLAFLNTNIGCKTIRMSVDTIDNPNQSNKISDCVLEQLTEVTTVTNDQGITEELYILHPPRPISDIPEKLQKETSKLPSLSCKDYVGYPCTVCGKVFTLKGNLKVHSRIHNDSKPFLCSVADCEKSFRTKDILAKHQMAHNGVKPFECKVCHQGFSSKISMVEHEARHTNSKPYKCKQCGQEFRQYSCLTRHHLTHKEEYPFQCTVCNKSFKCKVYLGSHMKVHTGETPFQCTTCHKRFKHRSDLKRHSIIHTGLKPYSCSHCGTKFSDASARRRHEREHHGEKAFACQICGDTFKRQGQVKTHILKKHSNDLNVDEAAVLLSEERSLLTVNQDGQHLAITSFPTQSAVLTKKSESTKVEKRMITHHVAVPKVNGKAVSVDPLALLDHIKDQLEPSQMPQTVDGQPVQLSCKVLKEDRDQQVVELQYLSTVHVECEDDTGEDDNMCDKNEDSFSNDQIIKGIKLEDDKSDDTYVSYNIQIEKETISNPKLKNNNTVTLHIEENTVARLESDENTVARLKSDEREKKVTSLKTENDDIFNSSFTETFVKCPDFSNQEYYNWLSAFAGACKTLQMPLDTQIFEKISNVNKRLADVMANPKGVLANKSNFVISMSISKELSSIIEKHLTHVLNSIT